MNSARNPCFFCGETNNLMSMDTNSLIIDSVYIDFAQLIEELMQTKIDTDDSSKMICVPCKDQLSGFYIMKQQASKHLKPAEIRKMQVIDLVNTFLDSTEADCIVSKHSNLLAIHSDTNSAEFSEQLFNCNYLLELEILGVDQELGDDSFTFLDIKGDSTGAEVYEEYEVDQSTDLVEEEELIKNEAIKLEMSSSRSIRVQEVLVRKPKKYTKTSLDVKQREWVRKELKQSAFIIETSFGDKTQWCCKQCSYKSFSSENAFRMHLKTHVGNSELHDHEEPEKRKQMNSDEQSFIEQKLWIHQQLQSQKEISKLPDGSCKFTWSCSMCPFTANKRDRFRNHLQKAHTSIIMKGPSKHSCFECHLRFDGENHLIVHKNCHKIFDVIAPHTSYPECVICKTLFVTNDDLQIHLDHHKNNPEALQEPIPAVGVVHRNGETFVKEEDDTEVLDENASTCGHCLLKFASDNECKNHLLLYHATSFTCPFDSRVFSGIPTLSFGNHLRQCHPDIFPDLEIACSFCKMKFETVYDKLAHMKTCEAKMFQCDHCERSFFRKADLLHHLKVVTGLMVFACHLCAKRCKDQGDLKTHIRSHTNDRPYQCPHCEKAYKTSSARASHVESHMEQTHCCSVCNVKFRRRILYQRHMKLLHDEAYRQKCFAENTCKFCNKSYLRKTHFKNHMKTHKVA